MEDSIKFDPRKLEKLNDPNRLEIIRPDVIWKILDLKNPRVLVDIGAGTGFFAKVFAGKIPDGKLYACDSSPVMVGWMRENRKESNIIPLLSAESSIPLKKETADLIYMIVVHHELHEPEKLLSEIFRLLKAEGKIAIVDWKKEAMKEGPPVEIRIPEETVMNQLRDAGFRNVERFDVFPLHYLIVGQK